MQSAYQLKAPVPFGHKVKVVVPPLIKAGQVAKPIISAAVAKNKVAAKGGCKERGNKDVAIKRPDVAVKRPHSPEDADYNVCVTQ